ncbi:MAG: bifunctional 23S rRNA (guanine(2069)-N(7))-methyltransferase RlmK/23S rRNA (guanine(2445)-N(2))-methyltransferase RlmL [Gammaproteobacteria bacterium]
MKPDNAIFVTCPMGLSDVLADELKALELNVDNSRTAGVEARGTLEQAYAAVLWSRIGSKALWALRRFQVKSEDELYEAVKRIPWEEHMEVSATLAVDCTISRSRIRHSKFAALRVKDAICDRFREQCGERPSVDLQDPDISLVLHIGGSWGRLYLDMSGGGLHRRGYRPAKTAAPMRENLAAGILHLANWPELAEQGVSLFDPMCGSGTLCVEAALMSADIAPGLLRGTLGSPGWLKHDMALWGRLTEQAYARRDAGLEKLPSITGYDVDSRAIKQARESAKHAALAERLNFVRNPLGEGIENIQETDCLLVCNPPYGERLGDQDDLPALYARLGALVNANPNWHAAIYSAAPKLINNLGLPGARAISLPNAKLDARLLLQEAGEREALEPALVNRLQKNSKHLGRWARRNQISCYRLYDADLPEYAVAVDIYQGELEGEAVQYAHLQEYAPPATIDAAKAEQRLRMAVSAVAEVAGIPMERIISKRRERQRGGDQYQRMGEKGERMLVEEYGAKLLVNLRDYLDTGLFLDHRPIRQRIQRESAGKSLLNLYCYTAAVSVHAVIGGAERSLSVDMSRTYLDWARDNLKANGANPFKHRLVQEDCQAWLKQAAGKPERYDLIFLDPPSFSNSKRMEGTLDIQRDHAELIDAAMALLAERGLLIFSTNRHGFRMDAGLSARFDIKDITAATLDEDFKRRTPIHHCWEIRRKA